MIPRLDRIVFASAMGFLCAGVLHATDTIPIKDLPAAVVKAIETKFPNATVTAAIRDERNDFVYFTVTLHESKADQQVRLKEDGEFVSQN